jgi:prepilin-type N-terminal cleavage/methylation domain-containing protein
MFKKPLQPKSTTKKDGFSLTEAIITTAIIGTLGAIAYPSYVSSSNKANLANVKSKLITIPPTISSFIDETGELPTTWDDLSSIAVVMTDNGPATGNLGDTIAIPHTGYEVAVKGPTESIYTLTATPQILNPDENNNDPPEDEDTIAIQSCFNISNGANDITSGKLSEIANTLNCG